MFVPDYLAFDVDDESITFGKGNEKTMAIDKASKSEIVKRELPARVEASVPANSVTSESLVNGADFVILGIGRGIATEHGTAYPIYFQTIDQFGDYQPDMERQLTEDGKEFMTGKSASGIDIDGWAMGTLQFLTQSEIIIRQARKAMETPDGLVARLITKRSVSTGQDYYTLE